MLKKILKTILWLFGSIVIYVLASILISYIPVNNGKITKHHNKTIYINSNGVHLSIALKYKNISETLKKGLALPENNQHVQFGWGSEEFYLNVPTWNDLKFKHAFAVLFLNKPTLIEVSYSNINSGWTAIPITEQQLQKLNEYISSSFKLNEQSNKQLITQDIYPTSYFYKANGTYSPIKTCNTWLNSGFKDSGIKASFWTLFDFGLLNKHN